ncbi:MAG: PAS domain-containing protein [Planctomycetota bacterium]|jgi:PAS domain S-box-containing protein
MLDSESKKKLIEQAKAARRHGKGQLEHDNCTDPERDQVEQALRRNEQLYHAIFEGSRDTIFITAGDSRFVEVNEAASLLTGYSREELKRMAIPDLHEYRDLEAYRQFFDRIMSGEQVTTEAKILRKDGTKVDTEFSNRRIMIGDEAYMHTVARDISERKRITEVLRESREQFKAVFDNALVGLYRTTPDGRILMANPALVEMLGYSSFDELAERNLEKEGYEPQYPRSTFKEQIESQGRVVGLESAWVKSDGTTLYVRESAQITRDEFGQVKYYQGTVEDITDRRKVEESLRYRVEFEDLITTISTNLVGLAPDEIDGGINDALQSIGNFADVDRSYVFLFSDHDTKMGNTHEWCAEGIEPQKSNLQGISVEVAPLWMEKLKSSENIYIPRVADLPLEASAERELLQFQDIRSIVVVPMACGGDLIGFLGFNSVRQERVWSADIISLLRIVGEAFANALARKWTQEELLFKTALLEAQSEASIDGILVVDDQGNVVSCNERMRELWRVPHETWNTGNDAKLLEHAVTQLEDPDEFLEKVKYLYAHKEEKSRDEVVLKDGRCFDRYSCPLVDSDGRHHGRIWFFGDITDRKKAVEALHDSEVRLRALSEASFEAIFLSEGGVCLDQNHAAEEMFGYTRAEAVGRHGTEWIVPEDREKVKDKIMLGHEEPYEASALRQDGTTFPCEIQARMINYRGRSVRVTALRDITDRKRAETALRLAHDQLEKRVVDRTAELVRTNRLLEQKIAKVIQTEAALRERSRSSGA